MPTTTALTAMSFSSPAPRSALRLLVAIGSRTHVIQSMLHAGEGLGMPYEQIAARLQAGAEPLHDVLLGALVEIHHHVAAKNYVKRRPLGKRLDQIQPRELHLAGQFRLYLKEAVGLAASPQQMS